jgi:hypothetical protein
VVWPSAWLRVDAAGEVAISAGSFWMDGATPSGVRAERTFPRWGGLRAQRNFTNVRLE